MIAFFKLLYYYFQLSNGEKLAFMRGRVSDKKLPKEWLIFFTKLGKVYRQQRAARIFLTMCYNLIIFFELIYWFVAVLYFTEAADDRDFGFEISEYVVLFDFPAKILLGVFVLLFLLRKWLASLKPSDYLSKFVVPLLVILKEELHRNTPLELSMNLGESTRKSNYQTTKKNYKTSTGRILLNLSPWLWLVGVPSLTIYFFDEIMSRGYKDEDIIIFMVITTFFGLVFLFILSASTVKYPRIVTKVYKNEWLKFKARLYDKSVVECAIVEDIFQTVRKQTNPRGKVKIKRKNKMVETYTLKVALPARTYSISQKQVKNPGAGKQPNSPTIMRTIPGEGRNQIRQKSKNKYKNNFSPPNLQHFLRMVGDAYRQIEKPRT